MSDDDFDNFRQAIQLGPLALLRLRAEVLLQHYNNRITDREREELERIAVVPRLDDRDYLGDNFDRLFEEDIRRDDNDDGAR